MSIDRHRGILHPTRLPTFTRLPAPPTVEHLVRWFWIPEWDIEPGRTSRQHLISFPASNLVVEGGVATVSGPTTRASHRDLTGTGWAVGALLRPAAVPTIASQPDQRLDQEATIDAVDLAASVTAAWNAAANPTAANSPQDRHLAAVDAFTTWLLATVPPLDEDGRTANRLADLIEADDSLTRVDQVAEALHLSVRTVQRLARSHVGLSPSAMLRRRRLQHAAEAVREQPDLDLATVAAELGYADHAHLTREFRDQLGFTPSAYRATP